MLIGSGLRAYLLLLFALYMTGCNHLNGFATQPVVYDYTDVERIMESWVGRTEFDLLAAWGAPSLVSASDDSKAVQWTQYGTDWRGIRHWCDYTFFIRDGMVYSYSFSGKCPP